MVATMTTLQIQTPRVFLPLLKPARHKGAHGGRGSGKSYFFADLAIEDCIADPSMRIVCIREVQKSIKESVKRLLEDRIQHYGLGAHFDILETEIRGKNGSFIHFIGLQNHTAESIKSLQGYKRAWAEEAQSLSQRSIDLLRPTIREESSEMWWSWNPETEDVPVDKMLRGPNALKDAIVVEANWRDNPFFPTVLLKEMEDDKLRDYDKYLHIWEGHYRRTLDGSVYAEQIRKVYEEKRVCRVLPIAGKPVETFWDLGKRDHTAIWFAQMQLGEYRILDFYQNTGPQLEHYMETVRDRGYILGNIWLPHDADNERLGAKTISGQVRDFFGPNVSVRVIPRMSKKAIGIEAVRKIMPNCYFNEETTRDGLKALGRFRYDVDQDTGGYSQNPLHDENSDAADAFAQLALSLQEPKKASKADFSMDGRMAL